ncbi:MAG: SEC-C metal-binding domain-containing protein [Muribaculaceae bacterium]|nr:SEC-C metal-binding domain-containing protein [Muribaculaceae bacterium]
MANLRLKKTILEVVDNQLKANDPPCTKDIYEKLLAAGYSKSEAKDKIGAVALTEIFDILQQGKAFDEERYQRCLEEMLQASIDMEDDHHIETEWDEWDDLAQKGYECFENHKEEQGLAFWRDAWKLFLSAVEQEEKTYSIYGLMEEQEFIYPVDEWLQDYEMELGNAGKDEERIAFCRKVLEIFDWMDEDGSCFQCGIGDALFREGKVTEAYEHYESWLAKDPQNVNGIIGFSWILSENGEAEKAYDVIRKVTWGVPCTADNSILFMRARQMADHLGKEEESQWYQQQMDQFEASFRKWKTEENRTPIVKEKKIYPNDPCPCGSGKKYKKCCGR